MFSLNVHRLAEALPIHTKQPKRTWSNHADRVLSSSTYRCWLFACTLNNSSHPHPATKGTMSTSFHNTIFFHLLCSSLPFLHVGVFAPKTQQSNSAKIHERTNTYTTYLAAFPIFFVLPSVLDRMVNHGNQSTKSGCVFM